MLIHIIITKALLLPPSLDNKKADFADMNDYYDFNFNPILSGYILCIIQK